MANPFSGLENIGQSYLAGVQLAQQRQYREDAIAQRQEEARIRERYYQDLIDQRREAAALNAKLRQEGLAMKFGRFLRFDKNGDIDIVGSATAQEEAGNRNNYLETVGFAEAQGISIPGAELTSDERKSQFFNRGRAQGIVQKTKDDIRMEGILASQGLFRAGKGPVSTADVEPMITGQRPETIFDILAPAPQRSPSRGYVERPAGPTPSRTSLIGAPTSMVPMPPRTPGPTPSRTSLIGAPTSMVPMPPRTPVFGTGASASMLPIRINNQEYLTKAPKTEKQQSLGYETIDLGDGRKARINLTPERAAQIQAQAERLASVDKEPDPFSDIDEAEKQLRNLRMQNIQEFNVERGPDGAISVVEDSWLSMSSALTPAQVQKQLTDERKRRQKILKETGETQAQGSVQSRFGPTIMDFGGQSEPESSSAISGEEIPEFFFDVSTGNWTPLR